MIRYLSILMLLVASVCQAAWPDDSICRVQSQSQTSISDASGFLVGTTDKEMLVMSVAHALLNDATGIIIWSDGFVQHGKVLLIDREKDLATLVVPVLPSKVPLVLTDTAKVNGPFTGKGWAHIAANPKLLEVQGKFAAGELDAFAFSNPNEKGMSGGPVFDRSGRVAGMIVARKNNTETIAKTGQDIKAFLAPYTHRVAVDKFDLHRGDNIELTHLLRSRVIRVPHPVIYNKVEPHKVEVVQQEVVQQEVVQNNNVQQQDTEPQFNFPVTTDDLDYATNIHNEVQSQLNEIDGTTGAPNETNVTTPPNTGDNTTVPPPQGPVTPPQPGTDQKLDQVLQATQALQQTIINNTTQAPTATVNFDPVLHAIEANKPDLTQITTLLQSMQDANTKAAQPYVLVTSTFLCDDCPGVVAKAKEIRDKKGINIRIVKLDGLINGLTPEQKKGIKLDGVPVLYDFRDSRTIVGAAACLEFLSSL